MSVKAHNMLNPWDIGADKAFSCRRKQNDNFVAFLRHEHVGAIKIFHICADAHSISRRGYQSSDHALQLMIQRRGKVLSVRIKRTKVME